MAAVAEGRSPDTATWFGQPRGLFVIAGLELWDRISFQGMQALLVLYMVGALLLPGHVEHVWGFAHLRDVIEGFRGSLSVQALSTQIFGLYIAFAYMMPVFGGLLGDRLIGRRRAVVLGALLMTAGHFCMAFEQSFLLALLLLILGAGTLRGNLAPQLGELYSREDRRRTFAFQIYGSSVNLGLFIAPLVTGWLQQAYNWHVGFAFAGFGMLIGLAVYLSGSRYLPEEAPRRAAAPTVPLTQADKRMITWLLAMVPVASLFWIAQSQVWNTYNLWVRDHIRLNYSQWTMPIPWLQSLDGLMPFICLPPLLVFWRWQASRGREPGDLTKIAIGCFIFGASTLLLSLAQYATGADGRASLLLPVLFHFGSNIGWLFFSPTIIALYSRLAPKSVNATMMGIYYLSIFIGSTVSGRFGSLYETLSPAAFWALHAGLCALGGVLFLVFGATMGKITGPAA